MSNSKNHNTIHSEKPAFCPMCQQQRKDFILSENSGNDGASCVECFLALAVRTAKQEFQQQNWCSRISREFAEHFACEKARS